MSPKYSCALVCLWLAGALSFSACAGAADPVSDAGAALPPADAGSPPDAGTVGPPDAGREEEMDGGAIPRDTVTVLAGNTATGFVDGVGPLARFSGPAGAALSDDGRFIYVADTFNSVVRKVSTEAGEVTTLAGRVQQSAAVDGIGTEARFKSPRSMIVAPDHSALYLADGPSIRRISLPGLEVTTLAGNADTQGYVDGVGDAARLGYLIHSMAISEDGRVLYLADRSNRVLRTLDLDTFEVQTVAGTRYTGASYQHVDGVGAEARFSGLGGILRIGGTLYVADTFNHTIRKVDTATWTVSTLSGAAGQSGIEDGSATDARFNTPQSLTGDESALYVTGWDGLLRKVLLTDGSVSTLLGVYDEVVPIDGTGEDVRLGQAFGPPLLDRARQLLYYNDRDASSLRRLDLASLEMSTLAGAKDPGGATDGAGLLARFSDASAVVSDAAGTTWYVADTWNHTLRRVDAASGVVTTLAGRAGLRGAEDGAAAEARFNLPTGLALDEKENRLFVSDRGSNTLRVLDLDAMTVSTLAGNPEESGHADGIGAAARFDSPWDLAVSSDGAFLYVADYLNGTVRKVATSTGEVTTLAGDASEPGSVDGVGVEARFRRPRGLALTPDGQTLFVADGTAHTVRAIEVGSGTVTTLAGQDGVSGVVDGNLAEALFKGPGGLAVNGDGKHLYVTDVSNHVVRRIDLVKGTVSTWWGDPLRAGGLPAGTTVPMKEATLYFPSAIAIGGADVAVFSEGALYLARPAELP